MSRAIPPLRLGRLNIPEDGKEIQMASPPVDAVPATRPAAPSVSSTRRVSESTISLTDASMADNEETRRRSNTAPFLTHTAVADSANPLLAPSSGGGAGGGGSDGGGGAGGFVSSSGSYSASSSQSRTRTPVPLAISTPSATTRAAVTTTTSSRSPHSHGHSAAGAPSIETVTEEDEDMIQKTPRVPASPDARSRSVIVSSGAPLSPRSLLAAATTQRARSSSDSVSVSSPVVSPVNRKRSLSIEDDVKKASSPSPSSKAVTSPTASSTVSVSDSKGGDDEDEEVEKRPGKLSWWQRLTRRTDERRRAKETVDPVTGAPVRSSITPLHRVWQRGMSLLPATMRQRLMSLSSSSNVTSPSGKHHHHHHRRGSSGIRSSNGGSARKIVLPADDPTLPLKRRIASVEEDRSFFLFRYDDPPRSWAITVVGHRLFEYGIAALIILHSLFLGFADSDDHGSARYNLVYVTNYMFSGIYIAEMLLRCIATGVISQSYSYLCSFWNLLDFGVVILCILDYAHIGFDLKMLRLFRLFRLCQEMAFFPDVQLLTHALITVLPHVWRVLTFVGFIIFIFATAALQLFTGNLNQKCFDLNTGRLLDAPDRYCRDSSSDYDARFSMSSANLGRQCPGPMEICIESPDGGPMYGLLQFSNVAVSWVFILQVCTLQGWSTIMYVIDQRFTRRYEIFFVVLCIIGAFLLINLISTLITIHFFTIHAQADRLARARSARSSSQDEARSKQRALIRAIELGVIAVSARTTSRAPSGGRTSNSSNAAAIGSSSSRQEDDARLGDEYGTGEDISNRQEYVSLFFALNSWTPYECLRALVIILNCFALGANSYATSNNHSSTQLLKKFNIALTSFFAFDVFVKMLGYGLRKWSKIWFNVFDLILVILSTIELSLDSTDGYLASIGALRFLRIFEALRTWPPFRQILTSISQSFVHLLPFTVLTLIYVVSFSLLGLRLFRNDVLLSRIPNYVAIDDDLSQDVWYASREHPRANFQTFLWSALSIFQIMIGDDWHDLMYQAVATTDWSAAIFFITAFVLGNLITLGLFMALVVDNFIRASLTHPEDLIWNPDTMGGLPLMLYYMRRVLICIYRCRWVEETEEDDDLTEYEGGTWGGGPSKALENTIKAAGEGDGAQASNGLGGLGENGGQGRDEDEEEDGEDDDQDWDNDPRQKSSVSVSTQSRTMAMGVGMTRSPSTMNLSLSMGVGGAHARGVVSGASIGMSPRMGGRTLGRTGTVGRKASQKNIQRAFQAATGNGPLSDANAQTIVGSIELHRSMNRRMSVQHMSATPRTGLGVVGSAGADASKGGTMVNYPIVGQGRRISMMHGRTSSTGGSLPSPSGAHSGGIVLGEATVGAGAFGAYNPIALSTVGRVLADRKAVRHGELDPTVAGQPVVVLGNTHDANDLSAAALAAGTAHPISVHQHVNANDYRPIKLFDPRKHLYGKSFLLFPPSSQFRQSVSVLIHSRAFRLAASALILFSAIQLPFRNPNDPPGGYTKRFLDVSEILITILFVVEMLLKMLAMGVARHRHAYLSNGWRYLEMVIALVGIANQIVENSGVKSNQVKVVNALLALRVLRIISQFHGLRSLTFSILLTLPDVINIMFIAFLFFSLFAIIAMNIFKGKMGRCVLPKGIVAPDFDMDECLAAAPSINGSTASMWINPRNADFDDYLGSLRTLFEVSTREMWYVVMYEAMDTPNHAGDPPALNNRPSAALFFVIFTLVGCFYILNLFTGQIVLKFTHLYEESTGEVFTPVHRAWLRIKRDLIGIRPPVRIKSATETGIRRWLFDHIVQRVWFDGIIFLVIIMNVVVLAMPYDNMSKTYESNLEIVNDVCTFCFLCEIFLKWLALGVPAYFKDPWNVFDFLVVFISMLAFGDRFGAFVGVPVTPSLFRVFRVFRAFRMFKRFQGVRVTVETMLLALPSLVKLSVLLFIVIYGYTVAGMSLWGEIKRQHFITDYSNFSEFSQALVTLFRISTGEHWNGLMHDCQVQTPFCTRGADCGQYYTAYIYFMSFVIITTFLGLNLFIALLLFQFKRALLDIDPPVTSAQLEAFVHSWRRKFNSVLIDAGQIGPFLCKLSLPLGWQHAPRFSMFMASQLQIPIIFVPDPVDVAASAQAAQMAAAAVKAAGGPGGTLAINRRAAEAAKIAAATIRIRKKPMVHFIDVLEACVARVFRQSYPQFRWEDIPPDNADMRELLELQRDKYPDLMPTRYRLLLPHRMAAGIITGTWQRFIKNKSYDLKDYEEISARRRFDQYHRSASVPVVASSEDDDESSSDEEDEETISNVRAANDESSSSGGGGDGSNGNGGDSSHGYGSGIDQRSPPSSRGGRRRPGSPGAFSFGGGGGGGSSSKAPAIRREVEDFDHVLDVEEALVYKGGVAINDDRLPPAMSPLQRNTSAPPVLMSPPSPIPRAVRLQPAGGEDAAGHEPTRHSPHSHGPLSAHGHSHHPLRHPAHMDIPASASATTSYSLSASPQPSPPRSHSPSPSPPPVSRYG